MQHIRTLTRSAPKHVDSDTHGCKPKPSAEPPAGSIPSAWIDALMARFGRIWGSRWLDQVEACGGIESVSEEWQQGLAGLNGEQIKRALERCRQSSTWPPSIAEFRQAGGDGFTPEQRAFMRRLAEQDAATRRLPRETWADQRERGKAHLRAIKATLNGAEKPSQAADAAPEVEPDRQDT